MEVAVLTVVLRAWLSGESPGDRSRPAGPAGPAAAGYQSPACWGRLTRRERPLEAERGRRPAAALPGRHACVTVEAR